MDVEDLASHAVAMIVGYGQRVAGRVGGRLEDAAVDRLVRLVRQRLAVDEEGGSALARVAGGPVDPAGADDLTAALTRALREDPGFCSDVEDLVLAVRHTVAAGSSGPVNAHVSVGKMRGSQLSLGPMTINNTRQVRFAFGGIGVAVVLVVLALMAWSRSDDEPPPTRSDGVDTSVPTSPSPEAVTTTSVVVIPTIGLAEVAAGFRSVGAEPRTWEGALERTCDTGVVLPAYEGFVSADGHASATVYESEAAAGQYIDSLSAVLHHVQETGDPVLCVDDDGGGLSYEPPSTVLRSSGEALTFEATATRLGPGGTVDEHFDWAATAVTCRNLVVDGFPESLVPATIELLPCD